MKVPFLDLHLVRGATLREKDSAIRGLCCVVHHAREALEPFALIGWLSRRAGRQDEPDEAIAGTCIHTQLPLGDFRRADDAHQEIGRLRRLGR